MGKSRSYIGTSGWQYNHWIGTFYPKDVKQADRFQYYLKFFNTVELNSPFYRLPGKEIFIKWRKSVPEDFIFSVKANRFITHMKKLKDPAESLDKMLEHTMALKEKLGPILFQLPPGWKINAERLRNFISELPPGLRYTFEFRNQTWYEEDIFELLKEYNCSFCIYELEGHITPFKITADFVYVRLHGPGAKYSGSYSDKVLKTWSKRCIEWMNDKKDVYVYFDNDQAAYAPFNAIRLKELLEKDYGKNS